jgi:hypothetical protein
MSEYFFFEDNIDERVSRAKERARKLLAGDPESPDDVIYALRAILCREYKMPLFDPYFQDRTIDELVFEIELVRGQQISGTQRGSEMLKEQKEEAQDLFADWEAAETGENLVDEKFVEEAKRFMQTGEFK